MMPVCICGEILELFVVTWFFLQPFCRSCRPLRLCSALRMAPQATARRVWARAINVNSHTDPQSSIYHRGNTYLPLRDWARHTHTQFIDVVGSLIPIYLLSDTRHAITNVFPEKRPLHDGQGGSKLWDKSTTVHPVLVPTGLGGISTVTMPQEE